ncbi:differentiation-specific protein 35-2 [Naegleria gruberi]|uniref:Differentiation-specific protein 35-2 n=1 Tax=Naegleria gruberi TaxID=5762 RepID=D2UZA9_NAEGR|nr:differentiation-specific protein 35-2 [Naegleria gruberi]EFC50119.1 differentiation-specific protein 35-2 [Naegleria gruberi]|eukprot:XP_002682863.1 differentiation-specific protein 35-2 [Naegleria gruberi strain NEG-M]
MNNKTIVPAMRQLATLIKKHPNAKIMIAPTTRNLHKQHKTPGFFDQVSGIYATTGHKLDMKPFEFREGEPLWYSNFLGGIIISVPVAMGFFACFFSLFWYTFFDSQTTLGRSNPHPFLSIKNGSDSQATINPLFRFCYPYGPQASDFKMLFWNELNKAKKHEL